MASIVKLNSLLNELGKRINIEIFRGMVLEVVQRIISEILQPLIDLPNASLSLLIVAHANLLYVKKEVLKERLISDDKGEEDEDDDMIDLDKTKETFWHLITGSTN